MSRRRKAYDWWRDLCGFRFSYHGRMIKLISAYLKYDPATKSALEVLFLYPGVKAVVYHRIAHFFYRMKIPFLPRAISEWSRFLTGIEIHPAAKIGKNLII